MKLSRRRFLQAGLGTAAASLAEARGLAAAARLLAGRGPVQLGIIGAGDAGRRRASGLATLPGVAVAALCDLDPAAMAAAAALLRQRHAAPRCCGDFRDLVRDPYLDALIIATPAGLHATLAAAACHAGKDVFVERPLAENPATADEVLHEARRHNTLVQMAASPFANPARRWRRFLAAGRIGEVRAVRIRYAPPGAWRQEAVGGVTAPLPAGAADLIEHVRASLGLGHPWRASTRPGGAGSGGPNLLFVFPRHGLRPLPVEIALLASSAEHRGAAEVTWHASAGELRETLACGDGAEPRAAAACAPDLAAFAASVVERAALGGPSRPGGGGAVADGFAVTGTLAASTISALGAITALAGRAHPFD